PEIVFGDELRPFPFGDRLYGLRVERKFLALAIACESARLALTICKRDGRRRLCDRERCGRIAQACREFVQSVLLFEIWLVAAAGSARASARGSAAPVVATKSPFVWTPGRFWFGGRLAKVDSDRGGHLLRMVAQICIERPFP